jgi:prephenate dehydrogenase
MVGSVNVIGRGRVGSALSARLRERGVELRDGSAELVLLCVPDRAIAELAAGIEPGSWVAHVSG